MYADVQRNSIPRGSLLIGIAIISAAVVCAERFGLPLLTELQISLYGEEAEANIQKIETFERDDGDRSWTVDYINYSFLTADGFLFSGINKANSTETEGITGGRDAVGQFRHARVQYLRNQPERHRLKGWGYDGLGPPGSIASLLFRIFLIFLIVGVAYGYAYRLLRGAASTPSNS